METRGIWNRNLRPWNIAITEFDRDGEEAKINRKSTQTLSISSKINSIHHVKSAKKYFESEIQNSSDSKISYLLGTVDRPKGSKIEKFIEEKIKRSINIVDVEPTCLSWSSELVEAESFKRIPKSIPISPK